MSKTTTTSTVAQTTTAAVAVEAPARSRKSKPKPAPQPTITDSVIARIENQIKGDYPEVTRVSCLEAERSRLDCDAYFQTAEPGIPYPVTHRTSFRLEISPDGGWAPIGPIP